MSPDLSPNDASPDESPDESPVEAQRTRTTELERLRRTLQRKFH